MEIILICPSCQDELILHRCIDRVIKYCGRCGFENIEQTTHTREKWTSEKRKRVKLKSV